jgi:hypothetical protein
MEPVYGSLTPEDVERVKTHQTTLEVIELGIGDNLQAAVKTKMEAYAKVVEDFDSAPQLKSFLEALVLRMYSIAKFNRLEHSLRADLRIPPQTGGQGNDNNCPAIEVYSDQKEPMCAEEAESKGLGSSLRTLLVMTGWHDGEGYRPQRLAVKWTTPEQEAQMYEDMSTPGGGHADLLVVPEQDPDVLLGKIQHEGSDPGCFDLAKYARKDGDEVIPLGRFFTPSLTLAEHHNSEQLRELLAENKKRLERDRKHALEGEEGEAEDDPEEKKPRID